MGFDLDKYETVKDRITRFYADHIDGRIITELVNDPGSLGEFAAFKAYAYLGDTLKATGYAMEARGQGVNKDAWVENAETSAIGRALANMDYCGTLRPSREEMAKVGNSQGADELRDVLAKYLSTNLLPSNATAIITKALESKESNINVLTWYVARCKTLIGDQYE